MDQNRKIVPPRNVKQQEGPKKLWNLLVDWFEQDQKARFRCDEDVYMMELMHSLFDLLW